MLFLWNNLSTSIDECVSLIRRLCVRLLKNEITILWKRKYGKIGSKKLCDRGKSLDQRCQIKIWQATKHGKYGLKKYSRISMMKNLFLYDIPCEQCFWLSISEKILSPKRLNNSISYPQFLMKVIWMMMKNIREILPIIHKSYLI